MNTLRLLPALFVAALATGASAQSSSYYLFDGDSQSAFEVQGGTLVNQFSTFNLGYPVAIGTTIRLGHRDDGQGEEYNLNGTPTGTILNGSNNGFSQFLDGTTDGTYNYAVLCCSNNNGVVRANLDWSGSTFMFAIPDGGSGVAFDSSNNTFYVSLFDDTVRHYSMSGTELGSFSTLGSVAGLAYEQSTDTLWGYNKNTDTIEQYSKSGALMQSTAVSGVGGNIYGGEMAMQAVSSVPEPEGYALMISGLLALGWVGRRRTSA